MIQAHTSKTKVLNNIKLFLKKCSSNDKNPTIEMLNEGPINRFAGTKSTNRRKYMKSQMPTGKSMTNISNHRRDYGVIKLYVNSFLRGGSNMCPQSMFCVNIFKITFFFF